MSDKICKCGEKMSFESSFDDDQQTDHCFNVYLCNDCGMLLKDEVCYRVNRWIDIDGNVYTYNKTKKEWKELFRSD